MKLEEIITLLNAGYTKDEIQAFEMPENKPLPASAGAPAGDPQEVPAAPAAPDQDDPAAPAAPPAAPVLPSTDNADVTKYIAQLTAQVSSLTKQIQNSNLLAAQQPAQQQNTAEDILANLINPTYKGAK